jgi:iron complex outermembrane recepter protein
MANESRISPRLKTVTAAVLAVLGAPALAAEAKLEEIVVTGSYLTRATEADSMPIRVVSADDLVKAGSPSIVAFLRALPEASGSIGYNNSSQPGKGQGNEGGGSVNLRGLGPERGLVLLNGKRLPLQSGSFVNTNHIPMAAVERIEVLKDAASTTYGSDAITGVVNFITRRGFDGAEIGGDYTAIDGNDGDIRFDATWGHTADTWNILVSAGYQEKAQLETMDRDWANRSYEENPAATWNFSSNPSQFVPVAPNADGFLAAVGPRAVDVGCAALGGIQPFAGFCVNQHGRYEDLVAPQENLQFYSELNAEVFDGLQFRAEALYARSRAIVHYPPSFNQPKPITETVLPDNINPASYAVNTSPRLFNQWFVPIENPGLAAYAAANPSQFPAGTTGIFIPVGQWRPYFVGGNPFFGDDNPAYQTRDQDQFRISFGLSGDYDNGIGWDANLTYGQNFHELLGFDFTGVEIQLALRGLGGAGCNWQTGTPGQGGCQWLNPMSNAIPGAPRYGVPVNPGYDPAVGHTDAMASWLMREQKRQLTDTILEANYVLNGTVSGLALAGGDIAWAGGLQLRRIGYEEDLSEYADRNRVPCLNSPLDIPLADTCFPTPNTPLGLAVALDEVDVTTDIWAGFAEVMVPFTDRIEATLGLRFEDYGSDGGSTFNPQLRGVIRMTDWVSLRASAGTSFRAPPQTQIANNATSTIPNVLGAFRAVDTIGNPNLEPEEATTFMVGLVFQAGNFEAAIDYYNYKVEDILTSEPLNNVVQALFPSGAAGPNNCATLDPAFIEQHFVFAGACSAANLIRINLLRINGPEVNFDGLDLRASYRFDDVFGGALTIGAVANHMLSYEFDAFEVGGIAVPKLDALGNLNFGTLAHQMPETKANGYVDYGRGPLNLRWSVRYNSSYMDDQSSAFLGPPAKIDATTLHDVAAVVDLPRDIQLTLAVNNVFDEDPPLVRMVYSYDPMTADPLGRNYRVGLRVRF